MAKKQFGVAPSDPKDAVTKADLDLKLDVPAVFVSHNFNGANSTTSTGAAQTGGAGSPTTGHVFGINNNQAYAVTGTSNGYSDLVWQTNENDVVIEVTWPTVVAGEYPGIVARSGSLTSTANAIRFLYNGAFRMTGGTDVSLGSYVLGFASGDRGRILIQGQLAKVYQKDNNAGNWILTRVYNLGPTHEANTIHGITTWNVPSGGTSRFEDLWIGRPTQEILLECEMADLLYIDASQITTGTLPTARGGTGLAAPGASGNVLTSDGTIWTSAAPSGGGGSSFVSTYTFAQANSTYPDNATYQGYATVANGWPVAGLLTGYRSGTTGTQRLQAEATGQTYARYWDNVGGAWSAFMLYVDSADYTAKGGLLVGTGNNAFAQKTVGANRDVLNADSTDPTGVKWGPSRGGGRGTASTAVNSLTAGAVRLVTGSAIQLATGDIQLGRRWRWTLGISKTAAGTATWNVAIRYGTGLITDPAIANWQSATNTAAIDQAILILETRVDNMDFPALTQFQSLAFYTNTLTNVTGLGKISPTVSGTMNVDAGLTNPILHVTITPGTSSTMSVVASAEQLI